MSRKSRSLNCGSGSAPRLFIFLLLLQLGLTSRADVTISEFMAINNSTLKDEDGDYSDWLELFNSGTNTVNLGGWYLANSASKLTQWKFPSTNLPPNGFLVVFASNKNRKVAGAPLHTNFKLSGSGEYLALVKPDGVTKACEFAPAFPQQYPDIPYGLPMTGVVTTVVAPFAAAKAFVPTSDIGTAWRQVSYNDAAWTPGNLAAGFDSAGNYGPVIGLNLQNAMLNQNASAYLRVPFTVTNAATFQALTLSMRYDDGFVAYLNGTEVLRRNAPASLAWNSAASGSHGEPVASSFVETFETAKTNYTPSQYGSAPAPALQTANPGSSGGFFRLLYDGVNSAANSLTFNQTAPGLYGTVIGDFDFRVSTAVNNPADGFSFMIIPTSLYGTNGPGVNTSTYVAETPNYKGVFGIGFGVYPHYIRNDVSVHWDGSELTRVTVPTSTLDLAAGVFHHARITLEYVTGGARATVALVPNINGAPGTAYTPISNFFIPGINPFDCRVQFGARTGGLNMALDLDNVKVQFIPAQGALPFEDFDISPYLTNLVSGANLLAIQGLNVSASSSNFLIQPQLLGRNLTVAGPNTFLYPPTPGTWNGGASAPVVPSVNFWPPPGVYSSNSVRVVLSSTSSSAVIRYTLDGSVPGTNSPIYTNALTLTADAVLRAQATLNELPGPVVAANYILLDASVTNFSSNLPLIIVDTLGQGIPDGSKIGSYAVFIDTNTPTGRASLGSPHNYIGRMDIGLHGSSSLGFPKRPYAVELDDESTNSVDYPLLGLPAGNDWLLYPSYDDKTFMNNVLTEELFESMGHYAIRRRYAEMFLRSGPGKLSASDYQGIYIVLERIRVDQNRVNITKMSPSDSTAPAITGGYMFSKDRPSTGDLTWTTYSGQELIQLYPKSGDITPAQFSYLTNYINSFESVLYGGNWRDPVRGYAAYIDPDSLVDYHWIVEYSKNIDGTRLSNYMQKDRNGRIKMEPIWDWDLSWGNANYATGGNTNGWYYQQIGPGDDLWLSQLRQDPDFYQKIIDRWGALRLNIFNATNLLARVDQITNYIWEAQTRDFIAWPRLGTYVWPNPDGAVDGFDVDYVTPTTYDGIISQVQKFILCRYLWIDSQFVPAPTVSTNGASATMAAHVGSVYYTLDGSDPRASGGGVASAAHLYTGTVALSTNAGIVARAFYTNAWSPPASAIYVATLPTLRVTEINYDPAPPPAGSPYTSKDFEFLEIQNTGANPVNLNGMKLAGGVSFTFTPNQFVSVGSVTSNNFDGGGTAYAGQTLGQMPGPFLTAGPSANMVELLNSDTNLARNRISFSQTATGSYDRVTADFDFRATTTSTPTTSGTPTVQNFDAAGTGYTLTTFGSTPPSVQAADGNSTGSYLRLVPSSGGESGVIAFDRTSLGTFNNITSTFDFRISPPGGGTPADGMGFALLSTSSYGSTGAGPQISEEPNLVNSLGIGFDVYANDATPQEPNNNHVSLHWNGRQIGAAAIPSFSLFNGRFNRAQVSLWFSGGNGYVTVRLTPDINGTPGPTETVFANAVLPGAAPYESRVAFGARTGGAWAEHDLDNISVQFTNSPFPAGLSLLLLPAQQFGASGPGTSLSTFTDFPLVTNAFALDLAFNPDHSVNDAALYWNKTLATSLTVPTTSLVMNSGGFNHGHLELNSTNGGVYASASFFTNSFGVPGKPVSAFTNLFINGAFLADSRLELAARNGGLASKLDLDNAAVVFQRFQPVMLNPGQSVVVVHNLAAFQSRYGTNLLVAGEFSGSLNDSGDEIRLLGSVGETIEDFTYDPAWYPITAGPGFTLVAADPSGSVTNWSSANAWRPSASTGGSPDVSDPTPMVIPAVLVNEAVANTVPPQVDQIELYNPNSFAVDLSGWFLTDSFATPAKFRIPNGIHLSAHGYVTFSENDFNADPNAASSFALNAEGDDVWLFSADLAGHLTGYVHGFHFGASDEGTSFGRYVNSVGNEQFVAQITNTFGAENSGPLVGPVVISEIMHHPTNSAAYLEYIELQNITTLPVPLYSANVPTSTWQLNDAVSFAFPSGMVLAPGQPVLIVGFDPALDPVSLAAFRAAYGLSPSVPIYGPWAGRLSNSDERIELLRPGALTAAGKVPSVLVEAVHYHDAAPWPLGADGTGGSFQRLDVSAFGNDPANWFASRPSPGAPNAVPTPPTLKAALQADGSLLLTWPAAASQFSVGMTTNLTAPSQWIPVPGTPVRAGDELQLRVTPSSGQPSFYRLQSVR